MGDIWYCPEKYIYSPFRGLVPLLGLALKPFPLGSLRGNCFSVDLFLRLLSRVSVRFLVRVLNSFLVRELNLEINLGQSLGSTLKFML